MANIAGEGYRLVRPTNPSAGCFHASRISRQQDDTRTILHEKPCDCLADAHGCAGDDCNCAGEWRLWRAHRAFSNADSKASSDSDRKRLRRMPRSTSASRSAADESHSKLVAWASFCNSETMSVLRTRWGELESMNIKSC